MSQIYQFVFSQLSGQPSQSQPAWLAQMTWLSILSFLALLAWIVQPVWRVGWLNPLMAQLAYCKLGQHVHAYQLAQLTWTSQPNITNLAILGQPSQNRQDQIDLLAWKDWLAQLKLRGSGLAGLSNQLALPDNPRWASQRGLVQLAWSSMAGLSKLVNLGRLDILADLAVLFCWLTWLHGLDIFANLIKLARPCQPIQLGLAKLELACLLLAWFSINVHFSYMTSITSYVITNDHDNFSDWIIVH